MLFNSLSFLLFLIITYIAYWLINVEKLKVQNLILLIASYIFYAWWDWRFLSLIILSSVIDYFVAIKIEDNKASKQVQKNFLLISLILNLSLLAFFKYYNFFVDTLVYSLSQTGLSSVFDLSSLHLEIILPIGISFYTFQSIGYTIDVYKGKVSACHDLVDFCAYVSFFPQLVAGPIGRAKNLLTQFQSQREFSVNEAKKGLEQMSWGLFKKVVIADNAAIFVNEIFENYYDMHPVSLVLGAMFFSIQVYCDFSGYSDMAIGIARLFGFKLMKNFDYPFFATDYRDLWKRWHISLTTWFKDYLYYPLVSSSRSISKRLFAFFTVFIVSGLWHGASANFVLWGAVNAIFTLPYFLFKDSNKNKASFFKIFKTLWVFMLFSLSVILFRSETLFHAYEYYRLIFLMENLDKVISNFEFCYVILIFLIFEYVNKSQDYPLENTKNLKLKYFYYFLLYFLILSFGFKEKEFIYFAF